MSKIIYNIYKSGILLAKAQCSSEGIVYQHFDIYTGCWRTDWSDTLKIEGEFLIDVSEQFAAEQEFLQNIRSNTEAVTLENGKSYHFYKKQNGANVWAQREIKWPVDIVVKDNEVIAYIQPTREYVSIIVKEGLEEYTPVAYWRASINQEQICGVEQFLNTTVQMTDGTALATEVYLPRERKGERLPTILIRTPYGKSRLAKEEMRYVQRGYALVAQDTRGKGESQGEWNPFVYERDDGHDTLNWIASQPWANGMIGMTGASYGGFVQWACADNPNLKAIVSIVTAGSAFRDVPRKGGAYVSGMLAWLFALAGKGVNKEALNREDWTDILTVRPMRSIFQKAMNLQPKFWKDWMDQTDYGTYWNRSDWRSALKNRAIHAAPLILTGWYDDNLTGSMEAWETVRNQKIDKRLIIGPWCHDINTSRDIWEASASDDALLYDIDLISCLWFDKHLQGIHTGSSDLHNGDIKYYVTGANKWVETEGWPANDAQCIRLFLGAGGSLKYESDGESWDSYLYDPENPAPHCLDIKENEMGVPGNYSEIEKRADVLTYTTQVLDGTVTIAGNIAFNLYASSSAPDTDWVVRLLDVDEAGNSIKVSEGVLRARYRRSFSRPELMEPDKIYEFQIEMNAAAHSFKSGHALRISITSSAFGYIFPNLNSGNPPGDDTEYRIAEQRIYHGGRYNSNVEMPVIREPFF